VEEDLRRGLATARRAIGGRSPPIPGHCSAMPVRQERGGFPAGDPGDSLHLAVKGGFAVWVATSTGDTTMLSVLGMGDHFGELALVGTVGRRSATVTALEPAETLSVGREEFERFRCEHPSVDRVLEAVLAAQLRNRSDLVMEMPIHGCCAAAGRGRALGWSKPWPGGPPHPRGPGRPGGNNPADRQPDAAPSRIRWLVELGRGRIELVDPVGLAARARVS